MDKNIRILMGTKRRRHSDGSFHLRKHKLWQMTLTVGILPSTGRCSHVRKFPDRYFFRLLIYACISDRVCQIFAPISGIRMKTISMCRTCAGVEPTNRKRYNFSCIRLQTTAVYVTALPHAPLCSFDALARALSVVLSYHRFPVLSCKKSCEL